MRKRICISLMALSLLAALAAGSPASATRSRERADAMTGPAQEGGTRTEVVILAARRGQSLPAKRPTSEAHSPA